ncbi:ABC-three component system middle component 7 [Janthinobacterium sp. LB3P112]|uniref:ABC-three component system middle component 7 n=1 Tax=Janthinobacterium sp. LB3P112 TaxID=3424196 RepID=UPI003F21ADA0
MLVPTKFTRLEESTIFKMKCILAEKRSGETVLEVFSRTNDQFYDASEFLHAMDILFVLDILDVQQNSGVVEYA